MPHRDQDQSPDAGLHDSVVAGLMRHHGVAATAVGTAPGRVNLIGEHTDYLGGLCLPIALPHATWAAVAPLPGSPPGHLRVTSGDDRFWEGNLADRPAGWAAYVHGALKAVGHPGGVALHVESSVPVGAGLSSSAALICAVLRAATELGNDDLVAPAIEAEVEHVGAPTGGMDQSVSLLARPGHALLLDFGRSSRTHVRWLPEESGISLLVVDTGVRHDNSDGRFAVRRAEATSALASLNSTDPVLLRRRRHVESENQRVRDVVELLGSAPGARVDWAKIGELFTASHQSLRDDHEVSCVELDVVVEAALAAGALGARMTGGGFGGSAIVLCTDASRASVEATVRREFAARSRTAPSFSSAPAAGGARRWVPAAPGASGPRT